MRVFPDMAGLGAARSEEILRPVKPTFILLTLFIALLANIVPLSPAATALRPDILALVLLYWCIREPRYVGVGTAWFVGLIMDVADATLFGQHALASPLAHGAGSPAVGEQLHQRRRQAVAVAEPPHEDAAIAPRE